MFAERHEACPGIPGLSYRDGLDPSRIGTSGSGLCLSATGRV
jgi:hypothetical protein